MHLEMPRDDNTKKQFQSLFNTRFSVGHLIESTDLNGFEIKLRYCEKATKYEKSPTCFDIYSVTSKQVGDFFQNSVAFSENLNSKVGGEK